MSIFDSTVKRIYKCTEEDCDGIIQVDQKVKDSFLKECPFCEEESLVIHSGKLSVSTFVDTNEPKTLGSLAEKNRKEQIKRGTQIDKEKKPKPWWRPNQKINYNILKNPKKYVEEGKL